MGKVKKMKEILMSIRAEHNHNIEARLKTAELRLKPPKCELPFKVLTYECGANGRHKVVNEWICDKITEWRICMGIPAHLPKVACVSEKEIREYSGKNFKDVSEMHITNLKVYDKPKELSEFYKPCPDKFQYCIDCKHGSVILSPDEEEYALYHGGCYDTYDTVCHYVITRPPRSWCYAETERN